MTDETSDNNRNEAKESQQESDSKNIVFASNEQWENHEESLKNRWYELFEDGEYPGEYIPVEHDIPSEFSSERDECEYEDEFEDEDVAENCVIEPVFSEQDTVPVKRADVPGNRVYQGITVELYTQDALKKFSAMNFHPERKVVVDNVLKKIKSHGPTLEYRVNETILNNLRALQQSNPHAKEVIQHVLSVVEMSLTFQRPQRIKPILIVGEPGSGKTVIAIKIAKALSVPYQLISIDSIQTGSVIAGSDYTWSNTQPGTVFDLLFSREDRVGNPVIILDEVDKAAKHGGMPSPVSPLHGLLEEETSRCFEDCSIPLAINTRFILWIATANSVTLLDDAIRSRFETFRLSLPKGEDARTVTSSMARDLITEKCLHLAAGPYNFSDDVLNELQQFSLRVQKSILEDSLTKFMLEYSTGTLQRCHLVIKDDCHCVDEVPPSGHSLLITQQSYRSCRKYLDNMEQGPKRENLGRLLDTTIASGFCRSHRFDPSAQESLHAMKKHWPQFVDVIDYVLSVVISSQSTQRALSLEPLLLVGEPGVGKTAFVYELASVLKSVMHLLSMNSVHHSVQLFGDQHTGEPGCIFNILHKSAVMHPVILLDEFDKARPDIANLMLGLTEGTTARDFKDQALSLSLDASQVIWVATANDARLIDDAVLSRFVLFDIAKPQNEAAVVVFHEILKSMLQKFGWEQACTIADEALSALLALVPRVQRNVLRPAISRMINEQRTHLLLSDFDLPNSKRRSGFY